MERTCVIVTQVLRINSPLGPKGRFHKAKRLKEFSILNYLILPIYRWLPYLMAATP